MMRDIIKSRMRAPRRIETNCAKARRSSPRASGEVGPYVNRIVALWANGQPAEALDLAVIIDRKFPDDADIKCLLGRAHLRIDEPNYKQAEITLRKSQEMGCTRSELLPLWTETKAALGDWNGLLEITAFQDKDIPSSEILLARADAYSRLAEIERDGANLRSAAQWYLEGGKEINRVFRLRKASGRYWS